MGAVPNSHYWKIYHTIRSLGMKWANLHNVGFTHDEFLEMFASAEEQAILREANAITHPGIKGGVHVGNIFDGRFAPLGARAIEFEMLLYGTEAPLRPLNTRVREDAPAHLRDKLVTHILERSEINFNVSRALRVWTWLCDNCATPSEVRFIWPTVIGLCALDEATKDFGDKLRELKQPKKIPRLPKEVIEGCRRAAGTMASGMLLWDSHPPEFKAPVTCRITGLEATRSEGALGNISGADHRHQW